MKFDTYQEVTAAIVARLEAGTPPWSPEWTGGGFKMPHRVTGEMYRRINVVLLWMSAMERGLTGKTWMTFKQAIELGGAVRKGEKATRIVFFKTLEIDGDGDSEDPRKIPMLRTYSVFNTDQIDGLPAKFGPAAATGPGPMRDADKEAALRSCGATIIEGGTQAAYYRGEDLVRMPDFERFHATSGYLATLAHELCHWTGHKTRIDRFADGKPSKDNYAFEELVAELGAAFISARLGIAGEHFESHAGYLGGWLEIMQQDKRAIFRAAAAAQAAADMVLANAGSAAAHAAPASLALEPA